MRIPAVEIDAPDRPTMDIEEGEVSGIDRQGGAAPSVQRDERLNIRAVDGVGALDRIVATRGIVDLALGWIARAAAAEGVTRCDVDGTSLEACYGTSPYERHELTGCVVLIGEFWPGTRRLEPRCA